MSLSTAPLSLITIEDPTGGNSSIDAMTISEIYSALSSAPPNAASTISMSGRIQFFRNTPEDIAEKASVFIHLVSFHVFIFRRKRLLVPLFINVTHIQKLRDMQKHGTAITISDRLGAAYVREGIQEVRSAIVKAGGPLL